MVDKETGLQSVLFCHDEPNMLCYVEQVHYQDPCAIYEYMQKTKLHLIYDGTV